MTAATYESTWWLRDAGKSANRAEGVLAFAALVAFTVILILSPQSWFPILRPLRIAFVAAGVAAISLLWEQWTTRRAPRITREIVTCFLLLAWAFMTIPLSFWPGGSVATLTDMYIKSVIVFWILANVINTERRLRLLTRVLAACSAPIAATSIYNFMTGKYVHDTDSVLRITGYDAGLSANPNDLALMLNLLLPLMIATLLTVRQKFMRAVCAIAIVVNVIAIIVTFSRAGFLGLTTIVVAYFLQMMRRRGTDRTWAWMLLASALIALPLLPSNYLQRVSTVTSVDSDQTGSSQIRWRDNVAAVRFVMRHPVLGAGIGMDWLALNLMRGEEWYRVHNVYLQYAVDLGLPGISLFLLLLFGVFAAVRASRKRLAALSERRDLFLLAQAIEISIAVFALTGAFYPVAYHFYFYYMGGLGLGVQAVTQRTLASVPVHI